MFQLFHLSSVLTSLSVHACVCVCVCVCAEFCSMELCFYYDRKARACWKIISGDGPQRGKYSIVDARSACAKYGARLASVDTIEKINQLNLMLINIPGRQILAGLPFLFFFLLFFLLKTFLRASVIRVESQTNKVRE